MPVFLTCFAVPGSRWICMSGLEHDLRLKVLRENVLKLYEATDAVLSILESLKHFALRMAVADDLSVAMFYLQHIEALVNDLRKDYKELLERFEHLKKIATEPQSPSIQIQIMWRECIAESMKHIGGVSR